MLENAPPYILYKKKADRQRCCDWNNRRRLEREREEGREKDQKREKLACKCKR